MWLPFTEPLEALLQIDAIHQGLVTFCNNVKRQQDYWTESPTHSYWWSTPYVANEAVTSALEYSSSFLKIQCTNKCDLSLADPTSLRFVTLTWYNRIHEEEEGCWHSPSQLSPNTPTDNGYQSVITILSSFSASATVLSASHRLTHLTLPRKEVWRTHCCCHSHFTDEHREVKKFVPGDCRPESIPAGWFQNWRPLSTMLHCL